MEIEKRTPGYTLVCRARRQTFPCCFLTDNQPAADKVLCAPEMERETLREHEEAAAHRVPPCNTVQNNGAVVFTAHTAFSPSAHTHTHRISIDYLWNSLPPVLWGEAGSADIVKARPDTRLLSLAGMRVLLSFS